MIGTIFSTILDIISLAISVGLGIFCFVGFCLLVVGLFLIGTDS